MSTKEKILYVILGAFSIAILGSLFLKSSIYQVSSLKSSVYEKIAETDDILDAARKMAEDNINDLKSENIFTIGDLVEKNYLTGNEINPSTLERYDENLRVIIIVKKGKIEDIYVSGIKFNEKLKCNSVCYMDSKNYIAVNNDTYRILKIDNKGYIYLIKNDIKPVDKDLVESYFKVLLNSMDKTMVDNVISLTDSDIEKSDMLEINEDVIVNTENGYKIFNSISNQLEDINRDTVNVYPVVVLKDDLLFEKGTGSKFDPYILTK